VYQGSLLLSGATGICQVPIREELYTCSMLVDCVDPVGCVYYENEMCVVAFADRLCSYKNNKVVEMLMLEQIED